MRIGCFSSARRSFQSCLQEGDVQCGRSWLPSGFLSPEPLPRERLHTARPTNNCVRWRRFRARFSAAARRINARRMFKEALVVEGQKSRYTWRSGLSRLSSAFSTSPHHSNTIVKLVQITCKNARIRSKCCGLSKEKCTVQRCFRTAAGLGTWHMHHARHHLWHHGGCRLHRSGFTEFHITKMEGEVGEHAS